MLQKEYRTEKIRGLSLSHKSKLPHIAKISSIRDRLIIR